MWSLLVVVLLAVAVAVVAAAPATIELAGTGSHFLMLQQDGQVYAVGRDDYGQLGVGYTAYSVSTPTLMKNIAKPATKLCAGQAYSCVVDKAGAAKCVGGNFDYNLGDGTRTARYVLAPVAGGLGAGGVADVYCGTYHTCARLTTGGAKCWGYNRYGALGDGSTVDAPTPVSVKGYATKGALQLALGAYHTCLLNTAGKVLCFGRDGYGQLGDDAKLVDKAVPTLIAANTGGSTFTAITASDSHTCALIKATGGVVCWGGDGSAAGGGGLFGMKSLSSLYMPMPVALRGLAATPKATAVWAGYYNIFCLLSNGSVVGVGENAFGVLGVDEDGDDDAHQPLPVAFAGGLGKIKQIRGGRRTTCVLNTAGAVYCVGDAEFGQRGPNGGGGLSPMLGLPGTLRPTSWPTTRWPTSKPTTARPTRPTTRAPTSKPTLATRRPTTAPTRRPTAAPTSKPSKRPTKMPTSKPTKPPTPKPSKRPTRAPTVKTTKSPTLRPTPPTRRPTTQPTQMPTTAQPTKKPTTKKK